MTQAVSEFERAECRRHESVCAWLWTEKSRLDRLIVPLYPVWWAHGRKRKVGAVLKQVDEMALALIRWERGDLNDDWFAEQMNETLSPPPA